MVAAISHPHLQSHPEHALTCESTTLALTFRNPLTSQSSCEIKLIVSEGDFDTALSCARDRWPIRACKLR
jgi:hypothetical protein